MTDAKPATDDDTAADDAARVAGWVARCRAGDGSAWPLLVARYQRLVHAVVRRTGLDEHAAHAAGGAGHGDVQLGAHLPGSSGG